MEPEEKARELVDKYYDLNYGYDGVCRIDWAKDGAIIAVDEILEDDMYDMSENFFNSRIEFWQEVKEEIKKL